MSYDEALTDRIRELIASEPGLTEKRMFGGLCFLLDGHMSVAASSRGGLLLRCDPEDQAKLLTRPHTSPWIMRGRAARGWLRVAADGVIEDADLSFWVEQGVNFVQTLAPKSAPEPRE